MHCQTQPRNRPSVRLRVLFGRPRRGERPRPARVRLPAAGAHPRLAGQVRVFARLSLLLRRASAGAGSPGCKGADIPHELPPPVAAGVAQPEQRVLRLRRCASTHKQCCRSRRSCCVPPLRPLIPSFGCSGQGRSFQPCGLVAPAVQAARRATARRHDPARRLRSEGSHRRKIVPLSRIACCPSR